MTVFLSFVMLALVLYATVCVFSLAGWCLRQVCARLYYLWWPW